MRICVCTVVCHPEDARILHRQIRALLDAGHEVTYIAPFRAFNVTPWRNVSPVDVPLATGRRRVSAIRAARRALAEHAGYADLVLLHDPELMIWLPRQVRRRTVVLDVRDDPTATWLLRRLEERSERRYRLLLAEETDRGRFRGDHPVVPNTPYVSDTPPETPGDRRVVYVGRLSVSRGADKMIELAAELHPDGIATELIGPADPEIRPLLRDAQRAGVLRWYGFVPNDRALRIAEGALAGLALLDDRPQNRRTMPAKVMEYMAHGIPVITTPVAEFVESGGTGVVVPFGDTAAAAAAVRKLREDAKLRAAMGRRGYETAHTQFQWPVHAERFVTQLESWAGRPRELLHERA